MATSKPFVWGAGGAQLTPEQIAQRREVAEEMIRRGMDTSPVDSAWQGAARLAQSLVGVLKERQLGRQENEGKASASQDFEAAMKGLRGMSPARATAGDTGAAAATPAAIDPVTGDVYNQFIAGARESGLTNPYGLAAVAATGRAESGWSPQNANRRWSDPSQSGQAGTAGGIMSWRNERLSALEKFAQEAGEDPANINPATQAKFFAQEDPALIEKLNAAQSVEEAQSLMDNAWRYAGYNAPSKERANRLAYAQSYLPTFQGDQTGQEVASLDPAAGAGGAYVDPAVSSVDGRAARAGGEMLPQPAITDEAGVSAADQSTPMSGRGQVAQAYADRIAQPQADQAQNPMMNEAMIQALSNPYLDPRRKAVIQAMMQQQQAQFDAEREQRTWMQRQQYEQQMKQSDPGYAADLEFKRAQTEALRRKSVDGDETFFGNPIAVQGADGKIKYGQMGNKGGFKEINPGAGNSFAPPTRTVNTQTEQIVMDNFGNELYRIPIENRTAARDTAVGTTEGKAQAEAAASLPTDLMNADATVKDVDALINHKGLSSIFGSLDQYRPAWTMSSAGKDAMARYNQIKGKVFLQGYSMLKGGGQITEVEGLKAEQAAARLDRAQSEEEAVNALRDFRDAVEEGARKLKQKAGIKTDDKPIGEKKTKIGGYVIECPFKNAV